MKALLSLTDRRTREACTRVAFLSRYYGLPLEYLGNYRELTGRGGSVTGWIWRNDEQELSIRQRWDALPFAPDYFVVTDFNE